MKQPYLSMLESLRIGASLESEAVIAIGEQFASASEDQKRQVAVTHCEWLLELANDLRPLSDDDLDLIALTGQLLAPFEGSETVELWGAIISSLEEKWPTEEERDCLYALARLLVEVGEHSSPGFWLSVYQRHGCDFLPISLGAASTASWEEFVEFFALLLPNREAAEAAIGLLPALEASAGRERAAASALLLWRQLRENDQLLVGSLLVPGHLDDSPLSVEASLMYLLGLSDAGPSARRGLVAAWTILEAVEKATDSELAGVWELAVRLSEPHFSLLCEENVSRSPATVVALALLRAAVVAAFLKSLQTDAIPDASLVREFAESVPKAEALEVLLWSIGTGALEPSEAESLMEPARPISLANKLRAEPPWKNRPSLQRRFLGRGVCGVLNGIASDLSDLELPRSHEGVLQSWQELVEN